MAFKVEITFHPRDETLPPGIMRSTLDNLNSLRTILCLAANELEEKEWCDKMTIFIIEEGE